MHLPFSFILLQKQVAKKGRLNAPQNNPFDRTQVKLLNKGNQVSNVLAEILTEDL